MVTAAFWVIRWGMIMLWLMCQSVVVPLYQPITAAGTCTISPECNISVETYLHTSKLMWSLCWLIHFLSVLLHHALFSPVLCSLTAPSVSGSSSVCHLCIQHTYISSLCRYLVVSEGLAKSEFFLEKQFICESVVETRTFQLSFLMLSVVFTFTVNKHTVSEPTESSLL